MRLGLLEDQIRRHHPELGMLSPMLTPGGTDARHPALLTPDCSTSLRAPLTGQRARAPTAIRFYTDILRASEGPTAEPRPMGAAGCLKE